MKKIWAVMMVAMLVGVTANNAYAEATAKQKLNALNRLFTKEYDKSERAERITIARLINNDCKSANSKIPNLSPAEQRWVTDEMNANRDGVWNSVEMAKMVKSSICKIVLQLRLYC